MNDGKKIRVCVLGAGAAGLCAARHLAADPSRFEFTVFERTSVVGGTWVYTDKVGLDEDGLPIHSSMYKNLRTNLPKEIMNFPDFREIKGGKKSCVSHDAILDYLKYYADYFNLNQFIKFNTIVESVRPKKLENESTSEQWKVKVKHFTTSETKELTYDAVMICNGHYFDPYIPQIPGLNNFQGRVLHSHDYRAPEHFADKSVILLGALSSGVDIAMELSETASRVYLSHNNERMSSLLPGQRLTEVQGIERFENGEFVLRDGTRLGNLDALVFCTGYHFGYPFLDGTSGIAIEDNHVTPLYKHLVNVEHPSMCIVGVPTIVVPFSLFHMQVQYFLSLLTGKHQLPPTSEMLEDSKLKPGQKKRHAHRLFEAQWAYNDELARAGGFAPLPAYYRLGFELWCASRLENLAAIKSKDMRVAEDGLSVEIA